MSKKEDYMTKCEKYGLEMEKIFYKDVCKQKKRYGISLIVFMLYFFIMNVVVACIGLENINWFGILAYVTFGFAVGTRVSTYIDTKTRIQKAEMDIDAEICKIQNKEE